MTNDILYNKYQTNSFVCSLSRSCPLTDRKGNRSPARKFAMTMSSGWK